MNLTPVKSIPGLYLVSNVFNEALLDQFLSEDLSLIPNLTLETWKGTWPPSLYIGPLRKTYNTFPENSKWGELIGSIDKTEIENLGFSIHETIAWADHPGFMSVVHEDDPSIEAALQVYLNKTGDRGTIIYDKDDNPFEVPFEKNCGYLLINLGQKHSLSMLTSLRKSTYTCLKKI
jgi:hypothetical protein